MTGAECSMGLIEEFAFGRAGGVVAGRCEGGRAQSFDSGYFFGEGFGPGTARLEKRGPTGGGVFVFKGLLFRGSPGGGAVLSMAGRQV